MKNIKDPNHGYNPALRALGERIGEAIEKSVE
jgi:hypothetical protein